MSCRALAWARCFNRGPRTGRGGGGGGRKRYTKSGDCNSVVYAVQFVHSLCKDSTSHKGNEDTLGVQQVVCNLPLLRNVSFSWIPTPYAERYHFMNLGCSPPLTFYLFNSSLLSLSMNLDPSHLFIVSKVNSL